MSTLKVGTIQDHTNSITAMTIDSAGRILQPAKPAFRARIATSSGGAGTTGTLIFETEDFDIGGNYNTSNGIFTAPIAGIYHFMFRSLTATNTSGAASASNDTTFVDFYKNGAIADGTRGFESGRGGSGHSTLMMNTMMQLSASDTIKVVFGSEHAYHDSSAHYDPTFEGYLVS